MENSSNRMRNLDSFLLFMTTIFGLVFSLLNILLAQKEIAYGFIPLLVIGLVIPIYVGYIRGAIILDTLEERVRGWIYFLYGVVLYLFATGTWIVFKQIGELGKEFLVFSVIAILTINAILGYLLGGGGLRKWFCRTIFNAFKREPSPLTDKIFKNTSQSSFYVGLNLFVAFVVLTISSEPNMMLIVLLFFSAAMIIFLLNERDIRILVNLLKYSEFVEIEFKKREQSKALGIAIVAMPIVSISSLLLFFFAEPMLNILLKIVFLFIGGSGPVAEMILTSPNESTFVKKKTEVPKDIEIELTSLIERLTKKKQPK